MAPGDGRGYAGRERPVKTDPAAAGRGQKRGAQQILSMKEATIYAAAVKWAEKNGITGGIGGGLFGSGNNCTRGQIVTFLYRAMK